MIYASNQIKEMLQIEREENSLVSKQLLDETNAWIDKFESYHDLEYDLVGDPEQFISFLNNNKFIIEQTASNAQKRKRKYGPTPKLAADKRKNLIGIYLTDTELSDIAARAGTHIPQHKTGGDTQSRRKIATYIRASAFGSLPPVVPKLNEAAWIELASVLSNLNQIAHKLNSGQQINDVDSHNIAEIKTTIISLRPKLLEREL